MPDPITQTRAPEITLLPEHWTHPLSQSTSDKSKSTREALGIPTDRPVVASGHQPIVFHPGIVAKLIAMDHWAKHTGSSAVWIVPDQDIVDPALIRVPEIAGDSLRVLETRLSDQVPDQIPSSMLPPMTIRDDLPEQLTQLGDWLNGYAHESSLARQVACATIGLLCEMLGLDEPTLIYASDLFGTPSGAALLEKMLDNPLDAATRYNDAVTRFPGAGVRELQVRDGSIELPLWKFDHNGRSPVLINPDEPVHPDPSTLLPRGLTMTAIMRSAVSDLFIHGTGGFTYDRITEHWMNTWLGQSLAPMTGATSDVFLDLPISDPPDPDKAAWIAHHARHDPDLLDDPQRAAQKTSLVEQIARSKTQGDRQQSAKLFHQLHDLLDESAEVHREQLRALEESARDAKSKAQQLGIAHDRSWAFPIYEPQQLIALRDQIAKALGD